MLLAIDAGNTDTVFGLFDGETLLHTWRARSLSDQAATYYESFLQLQFLEASHSTQVVEQLVLSSVVPALTPILEAACLHVFGRVPIRVGPESYPPLRVQIDYPAEIGSDLFANAVAAYTRYQRNCVVVDFGTALTLTTVSQKGELLGVAIAPGLKTAVKALFANTAQLPEVPLSLPASAIGRNTVHSIQAGILLGYEGLVKSLIHRIRVELNGDCIAVATGGLSSIIDTLQGEFVEIDRQLTLDGLRIIGEYHASK